jgi:CYTH domain-containing protein
MAKEIERKFLLKNESWRGLSQGVSYRQGYLTAGAGITVRVRIVGNQGFLTVKGATVGNSRLEFEYPIPLEDAQEMLDTLCDRPLIEKTRYKIKQGDLLWEIDEFAGENQGLILAEVELKEENQTIELPEWIDREVSDPKYFNANLAKHPYSQWQDIETLG